MKIQLKNWQHIVLLSLLAIMLVIVLVDNYAGKTKSVADDKNMFASCEISFENVDTISRLFYEGKIVGDSIQYQEIEGTTDGFMISIFMSGNESDYVLKINSRETDKKLENTDTLLFTNRNLPEAEMVSNFSVSLESRIPISNSNFIVDEIEFKNYFIPIICTRKDSLISFRGSISAKTFLKNSDFYDDKIILLGNFRADGIPRGSRIIN